MVLDPVTVVAFADELEKIAGEGGYYVSFFTGEKRKDATFFPRGAMNLPAEQIAELGKKEEVAPGGPVSAIRFINYYQNRAGHRLSDERKAELRKAVHLLSQYHQEQKSSRTAQGSRRVS